MERLKREQRIRTVQQCGYLLVKGLIKKKGDNGIFTVLDDLFEIPKQKAKHKMTEQELIKDFENYVKGEDKV